MGRSVGIKVVGTSVMKMLGKRDGRNVEGTTVGEKVGYRDGFLVGLKVVGERVGEVPQNNLHTSFSQVAFGLQQSPLDLQPYPYKLVTQSDALYAGSTHIVHPTFTLQNKPGQQSLSCVQDEANIHRQGGF